MEYQKVGNWEADVILDIFLPLASGNVTAGKIDMTAIEKQHAVLKNLLLYCCKSYSLDGHQFVSLNSYIIILLY